LRWSNLLVVSPLRPFLKRLLPLLFWPRNLALLLPLLLLDAGRLPLCTLCFRLSSSSEASSDELPLDELSTRASFRLSLVVAAAAGLVAVVVFLLDVAVVLPLLSLLLLLLRLAGLS